MKTRVFDVIKNEIQEKYKFGDIVYKNACWLLKYPEKERFEILEELVKVNILSKIYTYECVICFYNISGWASEKSELDDYLDEDFCDDCSTNSTFYIRQEYKML